MQTLTELVLDNGLGDRILTDQQLARLVEGSDQRRYNLVNRALRAGELHRIRRGLYTLAPERRRLHCHPFAVAQMLVPGSYVSLETALAFHGWIPEAVRTTASIVPGRKSRQVDDALWGRFSFHPLAINRGYFLELVGRVKVDNQSFLVAQPERALLDLVCLRKWDWQGLEWLQGHLRIDEEQLRSINTRKFSVLKQVYKQKRVQHFVAELELVLR